MRAAGLRKGNDTNAVTVPATGARWIQIVGPRNQWSGFLARIANSIPLGRCASGETVRVSLATVGNSACNGSSPETVSSSQLSLPRHRSMSCSAAIGVALALRLYRPKRTETSVVTVPALRGRHLWRDESCAFESCWQ